MMAQCILPLYVVDVENATKTCASSTNTLIAVIVTVFLYYATTLYHTALVAVYKYYRSSKRFYMYFNNVLTITSWALTLCGWADA